MATSQSHNPYVGPRPFEREEENLFFGREREISELQSLLTAHRTLLLYAASGAGKTSLLNAGLVPLMEHEGFEVLPIARVRGLIPGGVRPEDISNLYVFNTLMGWTEDEAAHKTLPRMSLAEFLKTREHMLDSEGFPAPRLIIFDQFEELFTLYQQYWKQREDFFHQVAEALEQDPVLRVLFVMREDSLARFDPYVSLLPEQLRARYRLVRLQFEDACRAVEGPLKGSGRSFADGVSARLVGELLKTKDQSVTGETVEAVGEYVEPVQLQIVCRNLWDSLPAEVTEITPGHLRSFGDVDEALKGFYENAVQKTISEIDITEDKLRKWFAHELITPAGTRGTVYRGKEDTHGIPNPAVDILENEHILRGELRAGAHWYELTHDRLIEPIRNSNEIWLPDYARKKLRRYLKISVPVVLLLLIALTIFSFIKANQAREWRVQAKVDGISEETSMLEKKCAEKGGLTDQELQQLSALTSRAETLLAAAKKAGVEAQLQKVLDRLSSLQVIDRILEQTSALEKSAEKGELTDQQLQDLYALIDQAEKLKPEAQKAGVEAQLQKVAGRLDSLKVIAENTFLLKDKIEDEIVRISKETSTLQERSKGELTDQQLQDLYALIDQAEKLKPEAQKAGVEAQLQKVAGRLDSLFAQTPSYVADEINRISQETSELEKVQEGELADQKLQQLSSILDRAQALKQAAQKTEMGPQLDAVLSRLGDLAETIKPVIEDEIVRISKETSTLQERSRDKLTDQELQQLSALTGRAETLKPAASMAGGEVKLKLEEVLGGLSSLIAQNTPNLKDKIHRISQEASALEKLVKRPKEELTKQELQQLQQLSSLIGGAETLRPAAKKAGVDSQLEEVLDKLNSLFAQNLNR